MIINPTIKLTEVCNFNCSYCEYKAFTFTQKENRMIDPEIAIDIAKQCIMHNIQYNCKVNFCWHGGEPLLYPINSFCKILESIEELGYSYGVTISHSLQSNGYLIDDNWLNCFQRFHIMVGISLDGPENINAKQREKGSVERVLQNIKRLKDIGCFSGVLTVLTENHKDKEKELFDFYCENEIAKVGFCKAFNADLSSTISNKTLTEFMTRFFDLYITSKYSINIREYNAYISRILKRRHSNYCFVSCRNACGHFITFNPNGDIFFCDDSYITNNKIGNIKDSTLDILLTKDDFIKKAQKTKLIVESTCQGCKLIQNCGCGCYRNDIEDKTKNYFCPTYKMLIPYIQSRINEML